MTQQPFRFLSSAANVEALCRGLGLLGLECVGVLDDRIRCTCRWLDGPIEIVWLLSWWPDGDLQQDDRITVTQRAVTKAEVDVQALLRQPHDRPLHTVIVDHITRTCG